MILRNWKLIVVVIPLAVMLVAATYAKKDKAGKQGEIERKVTEAEVPAAALKTLKELAAGAIYFSGQWPLNALPDLVR